MSSTRDFKSPGIFAEDATTVIPPTPIAGVAYRDAVSGTDDTPNGWRYGTRVNSQDWNQIMFLMTSMLGMMDKKGVLGWSSDVDYDEAAIVFGSDGRLFTWISASGPNNGGAKDPISESSFWFDFTNSGYSSGDIKLSASNATQPGWLKANGDAVSRTTYADLFAAIGTTFGVGDGSTTFNLPDTRGEFIRGFDDGRGVDGSRVFGSSQKGSLISFDPTVAAAVPSGLHTAGTDPTIRQDLGLDVPISGNYPNADVVTGTAAATSSVAQAAGVSRPRNVAMLYLIKT